MFVRRGTESEHASAIPPWRSLRRFFGTSLFVAVTIAAGAKAGSQDVTITVQTTVPPSCIVSNTTPVVDLGDIMRKGSASVRVGFSCNSRFGFSLSSQNGAVALSRSITATPAFLTSLPYSLSYHVETDTNALVDTCHSSNMKDGASTCKGVSHANGSALQKNITLGFSWDSGDQFLIAGTYQDVLFLRIAPEL
ncbi:hypothetical protein JDN40_01640 [Rhodomicrobium vannielii ATCC 17100]|uniref:hypothetical protein n=1 Tax=Rhodomicrobium vannielii TaxID=1069 RepID=UPI001A329BF1|nr:hypothetical protein [Rhodomicrobium vannielii]MBJ7532819.1 hypothetical protein [Rhodomicrobium vannielii ATCC 17100]